MLYRRVAHPQRHSVPRRPQCAHRSVHHAVQRHNGPKRLRYYSTSTDPESLFPPVIEEPQENTFVSHHYKGIDAKQIYAYLQRHNIPHRQLEGTNQIRVGICPCGLSTNYSFTIFADSGRYQCYRCKTTGSWFDYQQRMAERAASAPATPAEKPRLSMPKAPPPPPPPRQAASAPPPPVPNTMNIPGAKIAAEATAAAASIRTPGMPTPKKSAHATPQTDQAAAKPAAVTAAENEKLAKYISNLSQLPQAQNYLYEVNKIKPDVVEKYRVGATVLRVKDDSGGTQDHVCLTFPWIELTKAGKEGLIRVKTQSITDPKVQKMDPQVGRWSLFGWHLVPKNAKTIVVAQTELDCMAIHQHVTHPVVALPSSTHALPVDVVEKLEPFERIYLWLDDDVIGQEAAQKFANKLGLERVFIVATRGGAKNGPKSALEAHLEEMNLNDILAKARPIPHKQILVFRELRDEVRREFANPEQVAGIPSLTFPTLTKILKGFRKGELTVFTGATGVGKTTILSQLSLDYLLQGVRTLWGSFEINNVRLAKKMIMQFAKKNMETKEELGNYETIAEKFASLPLHFMRFHGGTEINQVLDAMEYAAYVYDVEHVILDNLQFMMPDNIGRGFDKFDAMDIAISKLRKFATTRNIHITLIIHPRKEEDGTTLSTSSVFGTAKATQEADNVLIVQKGPGYRYLEVTKNRFSGDVGIVPYRFNQATCEYHELTPEEVSELEAKYNEQQQTKRGSRRRQSSSKLIIPEATEESHDV